MRVAREPGGVKSASEEPQSKEHTLERERERMASEVDPGQRRQQRARVDWQTCEPLPHQATIRKASASTLVGCSTGTDEEERARCVSGRAASDGRTRRDPSDDRQRRYQATREPAGLARVRLPREIEGEVLATPFPHAVDGDTSKSSRASSDTRSSRENAGGRCGTARRGR